MRPSSASTRGTAKHVLRTLCVSVLLAVGALSAATAATASATPTPGVAGWGDGAEGALGNGGTKAINKTFQPASVLTEVAGVSAANDFGLALRKNGTVYAWGANAEGQLGTGGGPGDQEVPVAVSSLEGVTAISAGTEDALALLGSGAVEAWGAGVGGAEGSKTPKAVSGISEAVAVAAGSEDRGLRLNPVANYALLADGKVLAWGNNEDGQLGDGSFSAGSATPVEVKGISNAVAISAGSGHALALLATGRVVAWGSNFYGQLGDGTTTHADEPVAVEGLEHVAAVSAGGDISVALLESGEVMAWGTNEHGELGKSPLEAEKSDVPVSVAGVSGVTAISAGSKDNGFGAHVLALLGDGRVMAWGSNSHGQLGNGSGGEGQKSATPVEVSGLTDVTSIAAGATDSLAAGPPVPVVTAINPTGGVPGTEVEVKGFNLGSAESVQFGTVNATSIKSDTETSLIAVAPAEKPRTVAVTVTTGFGTSGMLNADRFVAEPEGTLEFGRCLTIGKHEGRYKKGCTEAETGGGYEWTTEIVKKGFTLATKGTSELEDAAGALVVCTGAGGGSGEYAGVKTVANVTLTFTGCGVSKSKKAVKCTSPGAAEGELRTSTLEGAIGFTNKEEADAGLELLPAHEGEAFLTYTCGTTMTEVRGGVFGGLTTINSPATSFKDKYASFKGKQRLEHFTEGLDEVLEASVGGAAFEEIGLSAEETLTNEEAIEINSVA